MTASLLHNRSDKLLIDFHFNRYAQLSLRLLTAESLGMSMIDLFPAYREVIGRTCIMFPSISAYNDIAVIGQDLKYLTGVPITPQLSNM